MRVDGKDEGWQQGEEQWDLPVTIGLDLRRAITQIFGIDAAGAVVIQRRLAHGKLLRLFAKLRELYLVDMESLCSRPPLGKKNSPSWVTACV